jgi:hypothetical protein
LSTINQATIQIKQKQGRVGAKWERECTLENVANGLKIEVCPKTLPQYFPFLLARIKMAKINKKETGHGCLSLMKVGAGGADEKGEA